jgi:hypothetical protein
MSQNGKSQNENAGVVRTPVDNIAPEIVLQVPALRTDSLVESNMSTLFIKGRVLDAGGISSVLVNGKEAIISSDGQFMAEVLQTIGKNTIKVVATDIAQNKTSLKFYSERLYDTTPAREISSYQKATGKSEIDIMQPSGSVLTTSNNKVNLKACINTTFSINKLLIYRDDDFIAGYPASQIVSTGNCAFIINEPVTLKFGFNEIKIKAFTTKDTVEKSIYVDYSLYAARNFALLIGNETYDDPEILGLAEPIKDVTELYITLTGQYNYDSANIRLLKNPTKAEIIGTLHQLRSQINSSDNLLIFYAGHGYWDAEMLMGYWLPKDAEKGNPVNWIPNTDLTNYIGAIKSKHTLLIADACFSGGIFTVNRSIGNTFAVDLLYQMNSRKAITSGYLSEVPDRSVFFQYLIKNLRENESEYLSAEELFSKMRMAVINNSKIVPQFGTIQNVGDEGGDFIFIRRRK